MVELVKVDSTNNYAIAALKAGMAAHGSAWFAYQQTKGKGQHGKVWQANAGENIILSFVVELTSLQLSYPFLLSAWVANGVYDFFKNYAGDETRIKWPNDLFWRDRKAGGILIEKIATKHLHSEKHWAVVGIGININQTKFNISNPKPVSLRQITGKTFVPKLLATELLTNLNEQWPDLLNWKNADILKKYNSVLYKKEEKITLKKDAAIFNCRLLSVNHLGELLVDGLVTDTIQHGSVEWVYIND